MPDKLYAVGLIVGEMITELDRHFPTDEPLSVSEIAQQYATALRETGVKRNLKLTDNEVFAFQAGIVDGVNGESMP